MGRLSDMPNIGKVCEEKLHAVGINFTEDLVKAGSKDAFIRLRIKDSGACLSLLCGLEGAIRGIRWHNLEEDIKSDLKTFYLSLKSPAPRKDR